MKEGDIVRFRAGKCRGWGDIALVYKVTRNEAGFGQVHLINNNLPGSTIPWLSRDKYIEVIIES